MATLQSTKNIIIFQANGDTAQTTKPLRLAGVLIVSTGVAKGFYCLSNGASSAYIIPAGQIRSNSMLSVLPILGAGKFQTGLKATTCSGCKIVAFLE